MAAKSAALEMSRPVKNITNNSQCAERKERV
jgi:hypothetical protein